jgi:hypothetical protein
VQDFTPWSRDLRVTDDGDGVVSLAGAVSVRMLADRSGLTGFLSAAFARPEFAPVHDRGRVLTTWRWRSPPVAATIVDITGITNRSLRARAAELLGVAYSSAQMSYDLRRLRLKGLIARLPGTNSDTPTPDGQRIAIFYTKLHDRLLRPLTAADRIPAPPLRQALRNIDPYVSDYMGQSRLGHQYRPHRTLRAQRRTTRHERPNLAQTSGKATQQC